MAYGFKDDKSKDESLTNAVIRRKLYQQTYEETKTYKQILNELAGWIVEQTLEDPTYSMYSDYSKVYEIVLTRAMIDGVSSNVDSYNIIFRQGQANYAFIGSSKYLHFSAWINGTTMYEITLNAARGYIYQNKISNNTITHTEITSNNVEASSAQPVTITLYAYDY